MSTEPLLISKGKGEYEYRGVQIWRNDTVSSGHWAAWFSGEKYDTHKTLQAACTSIDKSGGAA